LALALALQHATRKRKVHRLYIAGNQITNSNTRSSRHAPVTNARIESSNSKAETGQKYLSAQEQHTSPSPPTPTSLSLTPLDTGGTTPSKQHDNHKKQMKQTANEDWMQAAKCIKHAESAATPELHTATGPTHHTHITHTSSTLMQRPFHHLHENCDERHAPRARTLQICSMLRMLCDLCWRDRSSAPFPGLHTIIRP